MAAAAAAAPALDRLPPHLLYAVCLRLDAEDVAALGAAGSRLRNLLALDAADVEIWKPKVLEIYGPRLAVDGFLAGALGLPIAPRCRVSLDSPGARRRWKDVYVDYRAKFRRSYELWNGSDAGAAAGDPEARRKDEEQLDRARREYERWKDRMSRVQETEGAEYEKGLCDLAERCLEVLAEMPTHPGCFHILALICYSLNNLEGALRIVQLSQEVNDDPEQFSELKNEIESLLEKIRGKEDEEPLLENSCALSEPFRAALLSLFEEYDGDRDGVLSFEELAALIVKSNGAPPSRQVLRQICATFDPVPPPGERSSATRGPGLSYEGLCNFYLVQTLEDPSETRSDLAKHGFDSKKLIKVQVPAPA